MNQNQQQEEPRTLHDLARQIIDHTSTIMISPQWQELGGQVLPIQRLARKLLLTESIPLTHSVPDALADGLEAFIAGGYLRAAEGQIRGARMMLNQLSQEEMGSGPALDIIMQILDLANQTMANYKRARHAADVAAAQADQHPGHRPVDSDGDQTKDSLSEVTA